MSAGQLYHDVTVTSREGAKASRRVTINATQPAPQPQAGIDVQKSGPRRKNVGETALFTVVVKNTGEVPLTNVQVVDEYDGVFQPRPMQLGYEVVNDLIVWQIPNLGVGQTWKREVECLCRQPAEQTRNLVKVTTDSNTPGGSLIDMDDHSVEIMAAPAGGAGAQPGTNTPDNTKLRLRITAYGDTVRAGTKATYEVIIRNATSVADADVTLSLYFPPELTPDLSAVKASVRGQWIGRELRFEPIATLRPNEPLSFTIPANANQPGVVQIKAKLASRNMPQALEVVEKVEIIR